MSAAPAPFDQIAWVVDDLNAAMERRIRALGLGPWMVFRDVTLDGTFRGRATRVTMNVGLAYRGAAQIELIEVTSGTPSPYQDGEGRSLTGLHHVAWVVDDLDTAVAEARARGLSPVFEAGNAATRVAYLEDPAEPGALYEYIEGAGMRALIDAGIAETMTWDGSNPVREITM